MGTPLNEVWGNAGGIASVTTDHRSPTSYAPYPDPGKQAPFPPAQSLPGGVPMHPPRAVHPDLVPGRGGDYGPDQYARTPQYAAPPPAIPYYAADPYQEVGPPAYARPPLETQAAASSWKPNSGSPAHPARRVRLHEQDFRSPSHSESSSYTAPVAVVALALCVLLALLLMGSYFWSARLSRELSEVRQCLCSLLSQRGVTQTALPPYFPPSPYPMVGAPDAFGRAQPYPLSPLSPSAVRT
jgi:hypothetical protein